MKNKIKKFSKGDFRTVHPEIVLPVTNLEMTIGEGESCQGSFILKNRKEGDIRGLVYSSSFRIHLEEQGFEGNPVEVDLLPGMLNRESLRLYVMVENLR